MSGKKVLVIDDDVSMVGTLKDGLESSGFRVAVAYDGLQGVLAAHQFSPDIIFLDFNLPAGGGASVYGKLRNSTDTCRIPVVFITGVAVENVKGHIRPGPFTYFLKKPVSLTQMIIVLGKVLGVPVPAPVPAEASPESAPVSARETAAPGGAPAASSPSSAASPDPNARDSAPPARSPEEAPAHSPSPTVIFPASSSAFTSPPAPVGLVPSDGPDAAGEPGGTGREPGPRQHEFQVRVTYSDTDKMGIIYYANYFKLFELGRTELMRSLGVRYRDLEADRKLFLPVVDASCQYLGPSRYDDLLVVRTWLARLGPASVSFHYEILDRDSADRVVACGLTRHAVVNERWQPVRVPEDLRRLLEPYVAAE